MLGNSGEWLCHLINGHKMLIVMIVFTCWCIFERASLSYFDKMSLFPIDKIRLFHYY